MFLSFRVEAYICNSTVAKKNLDKTACIFFKPKTRCIYNGIKKSLSIQKKSSRGHSAKNLVLIANYSKNKGLLTAVKLMEKLALYEPESCLTIYGKGYSSFKDLDSVSRLVRSGSLRFAGYDADVLSKLHSYDVLVSVSKAEGVPASMLEAVSVSLPVVSFDVDGLMPSLCPNTGTPVPGGIGFNQTLYLFEQLYHSKNIIGVELVEVNNHKNSTWDANVGVRLLQIMAGMIV